VRKSAVVCLLVAGSMAQDEKATAFVDVTVVSVESGTLLPGQTVLVQGERITWVGPNSEAVIPAGATRVTASGRFLAPGLADMHAHVDPEAMGVFLAYGVTTVRELNGDTVRLRLRQEIAAGQRVGPTLIVSGPLLAGERQRWRHVLVATAEEARGEVAQEAELKYDLVKVYDGLSAETYRAIVAAAKEHGLPVTGHIPRAVGLDTALAWGQHIEHAATIIEASVGHQPDTAALEVALDKVASAGIWVTPTLAAFEALTLTGSPEVWNRFDGADLQYVDADTRGWWRSLRRGDSAPGASPRARARWAIFEWVVKGLARRRVPMLAGTDTPNPLMVPGLSLHEELRVLESAGLERRDVLAMATVRAAEFMGAPGEFGSIRAGARADLVLLEENPLENLGALREPTGVMARGRWYSSARLKEMLNEIARKYR
jgi:imidazolonepropionase-like amidohydrolase